MNLHQNLPAGNQNWPYSKQPSRSEITVFVICRRIWRYEPRHGQPGPVSQHLQSFVASNRQLRGCRLPRSGIPRKDPSLWAVMVNAEGLRRLRLPLARRLRFPTTIPCAMPVCSGFMQGWNIWPIVRERAEGRNFPKHSVLAALFCH